MSADVVLLGESPGSYDSSGTECRDYVKSNAILRLGHYLRRRGHRVLQIHHFSSFTSTEIRQLLDTHVDSNTKVVGLTTSFLTPLGTLFKDDLFDKILFILRTLRELSPNIQLVVGSYRITKLRVIKTKDFQQWRFDELGIDYAVSGPGENVIAMLANSQVPTHEVINGIKYIDGSMYPVTDFSENSGAPAPLIDGVMQSEGLSIELSHGCIFNCEFCSSGIRFLSKKVRDFSRSYESLKTEIVYNYENFGTTVYLFLDDMVNDDPNKVKWIKSIRDETGIPIEWAGYARLDMMTTASAEEMLASGCRGIYFGIESLKSDVGPKIGKITNRKRVVDSLHLVREVFKDDAIIMVSMIAGLPGETKEELTSSIDWMLRSEEGEHLIDRIAIMPLTIYRQDKGQISVNRNNPFSMYTLDEDHLRDYATSGEWTSPWGTKTEFAKLGGSLGHSVNSRFWITHPFYLLMYNNFGIKMADYNQSYRDRSFTHVPDSQTIRLKNKELCETYCHRVLQITPQEFEASHQKFWETFPILAS
jgi:radical SAM superfamily enzyme YgiQ (UPF0313 family)